uniref:De novo design protein 120-4 n=1 Tax=synthetic construct TaxID=32630 RepID=UPI003624AC8B
GLTTPAHKNPEMLEEMKREAERLKAEVPEDVVCVVVRTTEVSEKKVVATAVLVFSNKQRTVIYAEGENIKEVADKLIKGLKKALKVRNQELKKVKLVCPYPMGPKDKALMKELKKKLAEL